MKNQEQNQENIVKKVCKELGITQKELAERLGSHLTTIQKWASSEDMPNMAKKSLEMLMENEKLKSKILKVETVLRLIEELKQ